jgi:hypothetical protein
MAIKGTVGRGGSGKSLTTVERLWFLHRHHKRAIWSNTPLIDLRVRFDPLRGMWFPVDPGGFGQDWAEGYCTKFADIYDLDNCDVFLDEIAGWMPKHEWTKIPAEVRRFLAQDRREGVNIWWTHRTTRIFYEVLDNTAEITRCVRYGPWVVASSSDPETPDEKPVKKLYWVKPSIHDLYQTMARVGNAEGEGYGFGKREGYAVGSSSPDMILYRRPPESAHLGETIWLMLRPEQREALIRKFGPGCVGIEREGQKGNFVKYRRVFDG